MTDMRYSGDEFERESRYIENLVWDALAIESGSTLLFCGFGSDGTHVRRAIEAGARVSVVEHREEILRRFADLDVEVLRGSTSVIPAAADQFDVALAFHYLHEVDPFFHAQIFSELARVSRRVSIVEPAPPADALGKHIARLYSRAKRELGQFEYYQPLEYWKRLLQSAKADVQQHVFAFAKMPPQEYLRDTIDLILATMRVEETPPEYLEELRALARTSDAGLLPPARYVLTGAALGELPQPVFTPREEPSPTPLVAKVTAPIAAKPGTREISAAAGYEFPPIEPAAPGVPAAELNPAPAQPPTAPAPAGFGFPAPAPPPIPFATPELPGAAPVPPFGAPFSIGPNEFGLPGAGQPGIVPGWQWEPPEGDEGQEPT